MQWAYDLGLGLSSIIVSIVAYFMGRKAAIKDFEIKVRDQVSTMYVQKQKDMAAIGNKYSGARNRLRKIRSDTGK
jgi:hypothetical protein